MTYEAWRRRYWSQKIRFLKDNDKRFNALLVSLRRMIHVPESIDSTYRDYVIDALALFAGVMGDLMIRQFHSALDLEVQGWTLLNEPFIQAAAGLGYPAVAVGLDTASYAESLMERRLPSGMKLSGRILGFRDYHRDILSIINNGLTNELGPSTIEYQLDGLIVPGRHLTTYTPYGRAINYDVQRLSRTEVMDAFREGSKEMARMSPWVWGLRWEMSSSHMVLCECDELDGQVFAPADVPDAPHPNCACALVPEIMDEPGWSSALGSYFDEGEDDIGIGDWLESAVSE